jgi:hypothetical protein
LAQTQAEKQGEREMKWLLTVLFGWLFGHALLRLRKPEQTFVRKTYHAFKALTAKRKSSRAYHWFRLFD